MEDIRNKPAFTVESATQIAWEHFGIRGTASELPGERDQNFKIAGPLEGEFAEDYVLKIANPDTEIAVLELENAALQIARSIGDAESISFDCPKLFRSKSGSRIAAVNDLNQNQCLVRCISFLPGLPLAKFRPHSPAVLNAIGRQLGQLDHALSALNGNAAARRDLKWNLEQADAIVLSQLPKIGDQRKEQLLDHFLRQFSTVQSRIEAFDRSVIHNDANDYNLLVNLDASSGIAMLGLIDFGDIVYAATIYDLAICAAYLVLEKQNPIAAVEAVVQGYHQSHPLNESELSVVFPLLCMRLCQSVCIAAEQQQLQPDNEYLGITETPAWEALERLATYDASAIHLRLSEACNQNPSSPSSRTALGKAEIQTLRNRHVGASLSLSYDDPLHLVRGSGQYLYDPSDVTYLDCVNNVCHVGHCRPEIVAAACQQMSVLNTNTRYLHENIVRYAERLTEKLPAPLEVCFFVNSGSEANDLALRLARAYTGNTDLVVIDHAYHGHVSSLIEISPYKFNHTGGRGQPEHVHVVPAPDGYRGEFKYAHPDVGSAYAHQAKQVIDEAVKSGRTIAAFLAESLLGCGGQVALPPRYLEHVFETVRQAGALCIADEVQVGFGRVGTHFWGFEQQNVVPDIVTMGKPIGNGHPLAAVVTTRAIADAFNNGMEYFNTFGGNPVSCAVGLAVLDVIETEGLQQHAAEVGRWLLHQFNDLKSEFTCIGDVRGSGLFLGIELVLDRQTLEPAKDLAHEVVQELKRRRILLSTDGPLENVIKFKPPMVFSLADAERLVMTLRETLRQWWR